MSKISIKKPSQLQLHTLKTYLNKAINEVEKLEKSQITFNDDLFKDAYNQELEEDILALFAWLTTVSSFQNKLFIKDDED